MIIFLRDTSGNSVVDCEIYNSSTDGKVHGKVHVKLSIPKSWDCAVELKELKKKCSDLNGVSSIDDALDSVTKVLQHEIKKLSVKMNLRYIED